MSYERQTGRKHPKLASAPSLPHGTGMLWADFLRLHHTRGSNGMAPNRIGFRELEAFESVSEIKFEAWEIDAILGADAAYFAARPK